MSGGVDSSVSAILLKEQGFNVVGVFIKTWSPDFMECTWKEERLDAMRVCAHLDIPFLTLDLEKEYKEKVADYMIAEYKNGRTPNPDVMCNKEIKFGDFFYWAMKNGADFVATGHYAQNVELETRNLKRDKRTGRNFFDTLHSSCFTLHAGVDSAKDQSYFLWNIKKENLFKILFPVGHLEKTEVRKLAKKFGLPVAEKKDSQGICFLGKVDLKDFLSHFVKNKKGKVLNERGDEIGFHNGAVFLTIGERGGFTVTKKGSNDKPLFIVAKDLKKNTVTVSCDKDFFAKNQPIFLDNINTLIAEEDFFKLGSSSVKARVRYRQPLENCKFVKEDSKVKVVFDNSQAVASGQSIVFYKNDICLGGGVVV